MFLEIIENFNHWFALCCIFPAVIAVGLFFTFKWRALQVRGLRQSLICLLAKEEGAGNISRFQAIATVLAGNFGTGNISGMAVALATGGPGSLVWMWVMAFFGSAIQYASCYLSSEFRQCNAEGEYVGGPMYYLRDGMGRHSLGALFALFTLLGALTVGNFAQVNSMSLPLIEWGIPPLFSALSIAFAVGLVICGGVRRIALFAAYVVPFKAVLYLGTAFIVIACNWEKLGPALHLMVSSAFDFSSFVGGAAGAGMLKAMTTGFDRGLFATDAGTGIVPILQASARSKDPVLDGISTLIAPLMVMIVCMTTGVVLILTGAWQEPHLESTNMVTHAFTKGLGTAWGGHIVVMALILFAYTTILAWFHCGEKALAFLVGSQRARLFRYAYLACIPLGCFLPVRAIWVIADLSISGMLLLNLIGVVGLANRVQRSSSMGVGVSRGAGVSSCI